MKLKIFGLGLITVFLIISCEDFLDVDQPDIIEREQVFSDPNSIRLSILGLYSLMADLVEPMFLAGEVRADLVVANKSADTYIKEFSNNSFSASNPYISPKPFYTIINNTNDFLNQFEGLLAKQEMDSSDFNKYKSELVAIRVWSQYQIAKYFGTCKYYTNVLNSATPSEIKTYSFEDEDFLRTLISELAFSDTTNFTELTDDIIWQNVRFTDFYVNHLMGELYMDVGDYEKAIEKFEEVLKGGDAVNRVSDRFKINSKLLQGPGWFVEYFLQNLESSELRNNCFFMIGFDNKYNQTNNLQNWTLSLDYQVAPAPWYVDQFLEHASPDEEFYDWRILSIESTYFIDIRSPYAITKYQDNDRPFIYSRTARASLLKAWCHFASEGYISKDALKELNTVRKRIVFTEIDGDERPTTWPENIYWLEDRIIDELAYETGFEGQRWFDLMRVAMRRNDPNYLADKIAQKYPEESREKIRIKLRDKKNWYLPVYE